MIRKRLVFTVLSIFFLIGAAAEVSAATPYENYTYNADGTAQGEPPAYIPKRVISGADLGTAGFKTPKDVFVSQDEKIYIADTGNDRILVLSKDYALEKEIRAFQNGDTPDGFKQPHGLFVTPDDYIYVADTGHERVVVLKPDGTLHKLIGRPRSVLFDDQFAFAPVKIAVDSAKRLYIASENITQGIIELNEDDEFAGFFGAVPVKLTAYEIFWKMIATREQRNRMLLTVPTEYSSIDIDRDGFVYGVVSAIDSKKFDKNMFVRRLNPLGTDVLRREGFSPPMGDVDYYVDPKTDEYEISLLCDVAVRDYGIYSVLDSRKGRIFTYNRNGDLMYVFGALGNSLGQFGLPEALDTIGGTYLVADSKLNQLTVFEATDYGKLITEATGLFYEREYDAAYEAWSKVLKYTVKSDLAFDNIGKALIKQGDYEKAMRYLRLSNNRLYYSTAFEYYRGLLLDRYFTWIVAALAVLATGIFALALRRKKKKRKRKGMY